ncbi:MAG: peptidyl-prolyl cis-trans isomerase [Acidobacteriota bacterium]
MPTPTRDTALIQIRFPSTIRALASALVLAAAVGFTAPSEAQADSVNHIVLRVNDEIVTLYDYERRKTSEVNNVLANPRLAPADRQEQLANIGQRVMQEMFREMLLQSHARRSGMTVSEREVDDAVAEVMARQGIESDEQLKQALSTVGLDLTDLRANLRQELLLSQVVRRDVTGQIEVGDDELRAYYRNHPEEFRIPEERRLEEVIVLEASGLAPDALAATGAELREKLAAGADFAETVADYQDQGVTTGVIELGWLKGEDLETNLRDAAWGLEVGGYSQPVEARGGFHIVRLAEVRGGEVMAFGEVADQIMARERNRRFGTELRAFMAKLETTSHIQEDLPADAVGYRALAEEFVPEDELQEFRAPLGAPLTDGDVADPVAPEAVGSTPSEG